MYGKSKLFFLFRANVYQISTIENVLVYAPGAKINTEVTIILFSGDSLVKILFRLISVTSILSFTLAGRRVALQSLWFHL